MYILRASGIVQASIALPSSKSISNRVLILNALSNSPYPINNLSDSDDCRVMTDALKFVGKGGKQVIDIGAAGTAMRFLTAYLSGQEGEWTITGSARMKKRPIGELVDALKQLGAEIEYLEEENYPPLMIRGKRLKGGRVSIDGGVSSQFISALLMIAPLMEDGLELHLTGEIISRTYIRMTCNMMREFGIRIEEKDECISIAAQDFTPIPFSVESDWTAASYWYETIALAEEGSYVHLEGLCRKSLQGDIKVVELFENLGVYTEYTESGVVLRKRQQDLLPQFEYNFIDEPDLAQTFAVVCCLLNIPFHFNGLQSLKIKETNRIFALQQELKKLGYVLTSKDNSLIWVGERQEPEEEPTIETYEDHRMAMAFAPAALALGKIKINNPEVVNKSYPGYWSTLENCGFKIEKKI
ncbi:3-phosphoshikimate 1-carboxyvinyltransferase [Bacteroidales bacterium OttesenSCG-928-I14]|nr:3-phosphoshikimate 1-carboxyvinyltransferase [Bacteroidales bacterium OttesenSCG-928-I14]